MDAGLLNEASSVFTDYGLIFPLNAIVSRLCNLQYDTLSLIPAIGFSLFCHKISQVRRDCTRPMTSTSLLGAKMFFAACLIAVEVAIITEWEHLSGRHQSFNAAALSFLTAVTIAGEHLYKANSTAAVALSLAIALVSDWNRIQAYASHPMPYYLQKLAISAFTLKCMLVALDELPKQLNTEDSSDDATPKADTTQHGTAGFWSRTLLSGFSTQPVETPVQASQPLTSPEAISTNPQNKFWDLVGVKSYWLLLNLARAMIVPLLKILALRMVLSLFTLSQATFFKRYFTFADQSDNTFSSKVGLLCIIVFIHSGITVSRSLFKDLSNRVAKQMQAALTAAVHAKFVALPCSEAQNITATVNSNIDSVADTVVSVCGLVCDLCEVVVCGRWLVNSVGRFAVFIEFAVIASLMLHRHWCDTLNTADKALDESTSARVANASTMLSQIKSLQMVGLTEVASRQHQEYRSHEVEQYMKVAEAFSSRVRIAESYYAAPGLFIMGILHVTSHIGQLTTQEAFCTLLVVYLVFEALRRSVQSSGDIQSMLCHIDRMQEFFAMEEASDLRDGDTSTASRCAGKQCSREPAAKPVAPSVTPNQGCVVDIRAASLTAYSTEESIITNLTVSIDRHELVMVAGPVGCGKSTLLRSLIGDGVLLGGGFWRKPGACGYCDQEPWLQHASIQQNIIGRCPLDLEWYNAVLNACLLTQDLHNLTKGDRTIIGNNTSNLSHGQEHKVALARALYMRAPYLVLDGVFTALDRDTSRKVFSRIFGEGGLLELSPSTVVMTTNSRALLSKADKVVLMDGSGIVTVHTDVKSASFRDRLDSISLAQDHPRSNETKRYFHGQHIAHDEDSDEMHEESGIVDQLDTYLSAFNSRDLTRVLCLLFISAFGVSLREYTIHMWLAHAPGSSPFFIGCIVFTATTSMILMYSARVWYMKVSPTAVKDLYQSLLDNTMEAKIAYLSRTPHQTLLNLYGADMRAMTRMMPRCFINAVHKTFTTALQMVLIATLTEHGFVVLCLLFVGMLVAVVGYSRSSRRIQLASRKNKAARDASLAETASGLRHIRAFGWQDHVTQKHSGLLQASQVCAYDMQSIDRWLEFVMDWTKGASTVALLAMAIFSNNKASASITAVTMLVLMICTDNFVLFAQYFTNVKSCLRSLGRIHRAINEMRPNAAPSMSGTEVPPVWPSIGNISFNSVTASYDAKSLTRPALKMLSTSVESGQKIAIVGRTGSGKSSLLLALLNFLDYEGSIKIDDIDISNLPADFLRQRISTISTDVIDLDGTVRSNLCPWTIGKSEEEGDLHMESMRLVLRALGLFSKIIDQGGLDMELSELDLTHEDRQLLSVARGMLYNLHIGSNLVLMDETANDLDPHTEVIVHNTFMQVFDDHTVIRVMSRPDMLKDMDVTIRMLEGRIAEVSVNADGPAAMKALGEQMRNAERKRYAELEQRRKDGLPAPEEPAVHPAYAYMMSVADNPYAVPLAGPHQHEIDMLYERQDREF